ncbi:MAG: hypothetical protein WAT39_25195 [Planctomycetota bacterium]
MSRMRWIIAMNACVVAGSLGLAGVIGFQMVQRPSIVANPVRLLSSGGCVDVADNVQERGFTIVVFLSSSMEGSRALSQRLDDIRKEHPEVRIRVVDIRNTDTPVARQYEIKQVPTVWLYRDGKLVAKEASKAWRFFEPTAAKR